MYAEGLSSASNSDVARSFKETRFKVRQIACTNHI